MAHDKLPQNDGWTEIAYDLGTNIEDSERISKLLNEACHVFRHHSDGHWKSDDKDAYAALLAAELRRRPSLAGRLLNTDDRVIKMLTYRALELLQGDSGD
ncbi:MAG TPA: hypothetical protein VHO25_20870 [Polyangiaceae bacterium]|nr:hypothetical protein [Polyangiaceae bacterium]